jgi:hypothetical protein
MYCNGETMSVHIFCQLCCTLPNLRLKKMKNAQLVRLAGFLSAYIIHVPFTFVSKSSILSPDRRTNFQPGPGPKPGPEPGPVLLLCTVHVHPTKIG